jgi:hypothetical protein
MTTIRVPMTFRNLLGDEVISKETWTDITPELARQIVRAGQAQIVARIKEQDAKPCDGVDVNEAPEGYAAKECKSGCDDCAFDDQCGGYQATKMVFPCVPGKRKDGKSVIFVKRETAKPDADEAADETAPAMLGRIASDQIAALRRELDAEKAKGNWQGQHELEMTKVRERNLLADRDRLARELAEAKRHLAVERDITKSLTASIERIQDDAKQRNDAARAELEETCHCRDEQLDEARRIRDKALAELAELDALLKEDA